jgi:hypothetical protein
MKEFIHICDGCKTEVRSDSDQTPDHWFERQEYRIYRGSYSRNKFELFLWGQFCSPECLSKDFLNELIRKKN